MTKKELQEEVNRFATIAKKQLADKTFMTTLLEK